MPDKQKWQSQAKSFFNGVQGVGDVGRPSPVKGCPKEEAAAMNAAGNATGNNAGNNWGDGRHDDDSSLLDFISTLTDYTPTIPDELVEYYLGKSGFQCPDVRLIRLVAVAAQKFIADVSNDVLQHCKARQLAVVKDKKQQKDKRLILTMEDLSVALREHGVNLNRQEYFADSPSAGHDESTSRDEK